MKSSCKVSLDTLRGGGGRNLKGRNLEGEKLRRGEIWFLELGVFIFVVFFLLVPTSVLLGFGVVFVSVIGAKLHGAWLRVFW